MIDELTANFTSNGHVIYVDKYFGHFDVLMSLKKKIFDSVMNYSSIKPKSL